MEGANPRLKGNTASWESISPTQGVTRKRHSWYHLLKGTHRSVAVRIPNSWSHTKAWGANSWLEEPHRRVGVNIPYSRGHNQEWEAVSPNQGATRERGSWYCLLKGPHRSVGVRIPNKGPH